MAVSAARRKKMEYIETLYNEMEIREIYRVIDSLDISSLQKSLLACLSQYHDIVSSDREMNKIYNPAYLENARRRMQKQMPEPLADYYAKQFILHANPVLRAEIIGLYREEVLPKINGKKVLN